MRSIAVQTTSTLIRSLQRHVRSPLPRTGPCSMAIRLVASAACASRPRAMWKSPVTAADYPALGDHRVEPIARAGRGRSVCCCAERAVLCRAHRGDRGRLSRAATCAAPDRWATGVGAGSRWCRGGLAPWRRLPTYRRTGLCHRLSRHDAERVQLYIEESFTFWLQSPQAAVPLVFP